MCSCVSVYVDVRNERKCAFDPGDDEDDDDDSTKDAETLAVIIENDNNKIRYFT